MPNNMKTMQGCCCKKCIATFDIVKLGPNKYRFIDTSPGTHTRIWTSSDGGTSTISPWEREFPDGRTYTVKLKITLGEEECEVTHSVGELVPCSYCNPTLLPRSIYVTIPSVSGGPTPAVACKALVLPQLPGTWVADDPFRSGCSWRSNYSLGICLICPIQGLSYNQGLTVIGRLQSGFPAPEVWLEAEIFVGTATISTDCTIAYDGGSARYRKVIGLGSPVACHGNHTLVRVIQIDRQDGYVAFPSTITVSIPVT